MGRVKERKAKELKKKLVKQSVTFKQKKVKVGKKIKKGHITDTTFKTRKIYLKEQLKTKIVDCDNSQAISRIKNLLVNVQHVKKKERIEALNSLKDNLTAHADVVCSILSPIIDSVIKVCLDPDDPVRYAGRIVLKHLFKIADVTKMSPFFPVIVAYIRCAMTHISHNIRADSLKIVDTLMESYPQQIVLYSKQLLPDILSQISIDKRFGRDMFMITTLNKTTMRDSMRKPVLKSDPSLSEKSISWHLKVCSRMRAILKNIWSCVSVFTKEESSNVNVLWDSNKALYVPLVCQSCDRESSVSYVQLSDVFDNELQIRNLINCVTPLLYEVWIEATGFLDNVDSRLVTADSLESFTCVVDIINLLIKFVIMFQEKTKQSSSNWFDDSFSAMFLKHCMAGFPYKYDIESRTTKKGKTSTTNLPSLFMLNLGLCDVMIYIGKSCNETKSCDQALKNVSIFIAGLIQRGPSFQNQITAVVQVLRRFLRYSVDETDAVISSIYVWYQKLMPKCEGRKMLLKLLHDLLTVPAYSHVCKNALLWKWVASLPEELLTYDDIPCEITKMFQFAANQKHDEFLINLQNLLPSLLVFLQKISTEKGYLDQNVRFVSCFLHWVPQLNASCLNAAAGICLDPRITVQQSGYFIHLLNCRFQRKRKADWNGDFTLYFNFLFTIIVGCNEADLRNLRNRSAVSDRIFTSQLTSDVHIVLDEPEILTSQRNLTKLAVSVLYLLPDESELHPQIVSFMDHLLTHFKILPLRTVLSLIQFAGRVWRDVEVDNLLKERLSRLCLLVLEVLVNSSLTSNYSLVMALREFLQEMQMTFNIPNFSKTVCSDLLNMAKRYRKSSAIAVMGEIASKLTEFQKTVKVSADILRSVLMELDKSGSGDVSMSRWYLSAKYELDSVAFGTV